MRVVVTGATGFIGRHVVTALLRRNIEVLAVSRNPPGEERRPGVHWERLDVASPAPGVIEYLARVDRMIHLAWGELNDFHSIDHFEILLPRHYLFLKRLVEAGLGYLCVAGTCLEYGLQSGCLHEDLPSEPATAYGHAKLALYRHLCFLQQTRHFALDWARFFYLYGQGQPAHTLYAQVQKAIADGVDSFPMSPGEQLRDYLPVEEAAERLVRLVLTGAGAGVVNLCSNAPRSIRSMVEGWFATEGVSVELERGAYGYPDYEPLAFWGDSRKLSSLLESP